MTVTGNNSTISGLGNPSDVEHRLLFPFIRYFYEKCSDNVDNQHNISDEQVEECAKIFNSDQEANNLSERKEIN